MKPTLKKTWKKIGTLAYMPVAVLLFMVSCQESNNIDTQPDRPLNIQIDAMDEYTVLATAPGSIVFNVSANTPWTITSDDQWLSASPAMSASSSLVAEITVSVQANTGATARTGHLTVSAEGVTPPKVITVRQASKENLLVVPPSDEVPTEGGVVTFTVLSNKAWTAIPSEQFVADMDKTSGEGGDGAVSETITVTIPANPGAKRTGSITVRTAFEDFSFDITQKGYFIQRADDPAATTLTFTRYMTEMTLPIAANVEWEAAVPDEYAGWLKAEAVSQTELKVSLSSNLNTFGTGTVILKPKFIPDAGGPKLTVNQTGWTFGDLLASTEGTIDANTGWFTQTSGRWLTNYGSLVPFGGKWTFTFESITMASNDRLNLVMMDPATGYGLNLFFRPDNTLSLLQPQSSGGFNNITFPWSLEQMCAMRKIEIFIGSKTAPFPLILTIDGVKVAEGEQIQAGTGWPYSWCGGINTTNNSGTLRVVTKAMTYEPL